MKNCKYRDEHWISFERMIISILHISFKSKPGAHHWARVESFNSIKRFVIVLQCLHESSEDSFPQWKPNLLFLDPDEQGCHNEKNRPNNSQRRGERIQEQNDVDSIPGWQYILALDHLTVLHLVVDG